jgi:hypothetical protein
VSVPSPGRIVRYVPKAGVERAGMIIERVRDTDVHLAVFTTEGVETIENVTYDADGRPGTWHWPTIATRDRRRTDKLVVSCLGLTLLAVVVTMVVAWTVLGQQDDVRENSQQIEDAVCATVAYAERQADNIRTANPEDPSGTAAELEDLGSEMRETGIGCPARPTPETEASPSPEP